MSTDDGYTVVESIDERLNQLDRSLSERLLPYGVSPDDIEHEELVVEDIHELSVETAPSVYELQPESLSELKRWIGVNDESAPPADHHELPARLPSPEELESVMGSNTSEEDDPRDPLYSALHTHLFCDSRTCPDWSDTLQRAIELMEDRIPLVPLKTIHIKSGGKLNVSSGVSILFADVIRIENGGTLQYENGLKIDTAFLDGVP